MQVVSDRLQKRYELIKQNETRVEEYKMEDAEYCIGGLWHDGHGSPKVR